MNALVNQLGMQTGHSQSPDSQSLFLFYIYKLRKTMAQEGAGFFLDLGSFATVVFPQHGIGTYA
ncbi:MAG: hypothetical protein AMK69_25900 [Nitrospira bacterium SG8_3]|nr:MAG: hypothetical protein AMK69_25900 [Nitrospira bacterium SG8_3]